MAAETKKVKERKYLNKSFDSFKKDLLEEARIHHENVIKDFSDSSVGGMFLDFAAAVGDSLSFYLDHQFSELNPLEAVESKNIENHIKNYGVDIVGASPAVGLFDFTIEIPADPSNPNNPKSILLPIIKKGTTIVSDGGIQFNLLKDVDFTKYDLKGNLKATKTISKTNSSGVPTYYFLTLSEYCISGFYEQEDFTIGSDFEAYKRLTLSNPNVNEIVSVYDDLGNKYYEVKDLSEDTIFRTVLNKNSDNELVEETLIPTPAPYRFKKEVDINSRLTSLILGGGSAETLEDDIIPDPTDFALPLYGKSTFPIDSLNPYSLLNTRTLGVYATNCIITVVYQYGGGLDHSIEAESTMDIQTLEMEFTNSTANLETSSVRSSVSVTNREKASGGEDAPTIEELREKIPSYANSQSRVVTKEDLLARIYKMPSNLGRVYRAAIRTNPNNPLSSQLFIISRDNNNNFIISPDALKGNLQKYLSQFRLIGDAVDILDAHVINLKLEFEVLADPAYNKQLLLQNVLKKLKKYFDMSNFHIDQPIVISDILTTIYKVQGVLSINSRANNHVLKFSNLSGNVNGREYSENNFDVDSHIIKGLLIPSPGGIFHIKYPEINIVGTVI
jgi:hypothetical protein